MKACLMRVNYNPKYVTPHQDGPTAPLETRLRFAKSIYASSQPDHRLKDALEHENKKKKQRGPSPPKPTNTGPSPPKPANTEGLPRRHSAPDKRVKHKHYSELKHHSKAHTKGEGRAWSEPAQKTTDEVVSCPEASPRSIYRRDKPKAAAADEENCSSVERNTSELVAFSPETSTCQDEEHQVVEVTSSPKLPNAQEQILKSGKVENESEADNKVAKHKEGVAKAHTTLRLQPLKPAHPDTATYKSTHVLPLQKSAGARCGDNRLVLGHHSNASSFPVFSTNPRRSLCVPQKLGETGQRVNARSAPSDAPSHSKTVPLKPNVFRPAASVQREQRARVQAERAMRDRKVFTIKGPYHSLRLALRKRGWVEKFMNAPPPGQMSGSGARNEDEESGDDDAAKKLTKKMEQRPWEEDKGFYNLMSHVARSTTPTFMFVCKPADVSSTKSTQVVNHFGKSRSFTTKVGLSQNLRSVPWFEKADPDTFYPRCYHLCESEERDAFSEDFRRMACIGFIKRFVERYDLTDGSGNIQSAKHSERNEEKVQSEEEAKSDRPPQVSVRALEMAMQQCEVFLKVKENDDIDSDCDRAVISGTEWTYFLQQYNTFVLGGGDLFPVSEALVDDCKELLQKTKKQSPQYELDGTKNVWILKPVALSRGRGIQCLNNLDQIMKAAAAAKNNLIIQKYIERPFLVYQIKFDIRQWFLVSEMNPLTVWFYRDCYLRFCSQDYTLDNFDVAIHLSNNSVQKHFSVQRTTDKLPDDNTWLSAEFEEFLEENGYGNIWKSKVIPGMKKAIVCAMLCTQEFVEPRKSAFALYGADFMVTEDMQPWLLEINSSPSMARTTHATAKLVDMVLEDTVKVVLDRRYNRNATTGRFELIYKQPRVGDPPPIDMSLAVTGSKIKQPAASKR